MDGLVDGTVALGSEGTALSPMPCLIGQRMVEVTATWFGENGKSCPIRQKNSEINVISDYLG